MKTLEHRYQTLVDSGEISDDLVQRQLLVALQLCYDQLTKSLPWWQRWLSQSQPCEGLYLWGGVGIGKTFVMDLFYDALPFTQKLRMHFHAFMQLVQEGLQRKQGQANPLVAVAADIAKQSKVLCFDEFFVSDIGDAMILERLFRALLADGTMLIATSNIAPDQLYWQGLHRKRFLPAIELIKSHCRVIEVSSQQDYRYRTLKNQGTYFTPITSESDAIMSRLFAEFAKGVVHRDVTINIQKRPIVTRQLANNMVWFDFDRICCIPRSQTDYLEIADSYSWVFISGVPRIDAYDNARITYLIYLVDVFYDKHVRLVLSAEDYVEALYPQGEAIDTFQRTISRLHEMGSEEYFNNADTIRSP